GQLRVFNTGHRFWRLQDAAQLTPKCIDHSVAPKQSEQLVRVLFAHRREPPHQRLAREALALLDVAEHHRIDASAENLACKSAQGEIAAHQYPGFVEGVLDSLARRRRCHRRKYTK